MNKSFMITTVSSVYHCITLILILAANSRATQDVVGAVLDTLGLISVGVLLAWLNQIARVRKPTTNQWVRWLAIIGAGLSALMAILYTVIVAGKAHDFVTSGNQGYPEAYHLTSGGLLVGLPLLLQLGTLMLTIGCIWTSLNAMRVGLLTRPVGYAGVIAGALFLFPIGALVPIVQGFWLAAVAVILAKRWPSGDLPAWESGEARPWQPSAAAVKAAEDRRAARAQRGQRGQQRRRVSDNDVLAALDPADPRAETNGATPSQSAGKRKRKRKS